MRIPQFLGEMTAFDGEGQPNAASVCFNGRIDDTRFRPRYGYRTVATRPSGFEDCHLFEFVSGYEGNTNLTECISIEKRSGTVKPYSVNVTTGARTEITNGGVALSLPDSEHICAVFGEYVYIVCPGESPSVWKHKIGDNTSYSVVQDAAYVAPDPSGSLTVTPKSLGSRGWETGDVVAITLIGSAGINTGITDAAASGVLTVSATDYDRVGQHRTKVEVALSSAVDLSGVDYISAVFQTEDIYTEFERTNLAARVYQGSYTDAETYEHFNSDNTEVEIVIRVKGITRSAVTKLEFTIGGASADDATGSAFSIQPLKLGGTYLEASATGDRLWDGNLDGDGITYGFRYKNGASYSSLFRNSITAAQGQGFRNSTYSCPLGGKIALSTAVATSGGYTDVEFVRLTNDGLKWYIIGTVANSGVPQVTDIYEEHELAALVEATGTDISPDDPTPPFSGDGMTALFAAFGHMVWGRGTKVDYSAFGNPVSLYSSDAPTPDPDDLEQSVQWTLADNFADEVVAGAVAGRVGVILFGQKATYAQFGTVPVDMSPVGEVRGSRGIAGRKAFDAYLTPDGIEGVVSVDPTGGLWFVPYNSITTNNGQGSARVVELSRGNPDTVWEWLVDGQRAEFGYDSLELVQVVFCKDTGELRISLGNRSVVLDTINGSNAPQWTRHQYSLTVPEGESESSACTAFENKDATASSVAPGDSAWADFGNAFLSDDSYTSAALGYGTTQSTETLRVVSIYPENAIPIDATIDSQTLRIEVGKSGDLEATISTIQPKNNGANLGANLGTGQVLTTSDQVLEFALASMASVADINSGYMGVDIKIAQETWLATWNDPLNWTITVSSSGTAASMVVTATYIGPGTKPTRAYVNVTSSAEAKIEADPPTSPPLPFDGYATADNGLGSTVSGGVSVPIDDDEVRVTDSSTERVVISLDGSGVGTTTITRAVSGAVYTSGTRIVGAYTGSAALVVPTAATVRADDVAYKTCYTVSAVSPGVDSGVAWKCVSWLDPNKLWGIRSTGNIDEIRFNTVLGAWIEGDGRDGGYSMTAPYWESHWMRPAQVSLLAWVHVEKETGSESMTVSAKTDRAGYVSGAVLRDAYKFKVTQQGKAHKVKFTLDETSDGIYSATLDYKPLSNQFTR